MGVLDPFGTTAERNDICAWLMSGLRVRIPSRTRYASLLDPRNPNGRPVMYHLKPSSSVPSRSIVAALLKSSQKASFVSPAALAAGGGSARQSRPLADAPPAATAAPAA